MVENKAQSSHIKRYIESRTKSKVNIVSTIISNDLPSIQCYLNSNFNAIQRLPLGVRTPLCRPSNTLQQLVEGRQPAKGAWCIYRSMSLVDFLWDLHIGKYTTHDILWVFHSTFGVQQLLRERPWGVLHSLLTLAVGSDM